MRGKEQPVRLWAVVVIMTFGLTVQRIPAFTHFTGLCAFLENKEQLSGRAVIVCVTFTISSPFFKEINSFVLITHAKSSFTYLVFSPTRFPVSNNLKCQVSRVSEEERALSPETDHDQPSPSADVWPGWIRCLENLL